MKEIKKYELAVVIGRFQPFHKCHGELVNYALKNAKRVLVLVGSSNKARSIKNPLPFSYISEIIRKTFGDEYVYVMPLNDKPLDYEWVTEVQKAIDSFDYRPSEVCIVGHDKDESSRYLFDFPLYGLLQAPKFGRIDATKIRELWFSGKYYANMVPAATMDAMNQYEQLPEFRDLKDDFDHIQEYKSHYKYHKYPPIFVTVDAVVHCKGHILLIQRKGSPGKGQWAIPGGFIESDEYIKTGIFRELREETKIDVPPGKLKNSLREVKTFDNPNRSLRGRTITHAGLIDLDESTLPKVTARSDAKNVKWVSNAELDTMENQMFEDHYDVVKSLIKTLD